MKKKQFSIEWILQERIVLVNTIVKGNVLNTFFGRQTDPIVSITSLSLTIIRTLVSFLTAKSSFFIEALQEINTFHLLLCVLKILHNQRNWKQPMFSNQCNRLQNVLLLLLASGNHSRFRTQIYQQTLN